MRPSTWNMRPDVVRPPHQDRLAYRPEGTRTGLPVSMDEDFRARHAELRGLYRGLGQPPDPDEVPAGGCDDLDSAGRRPGECECGYPEGSRSCRLVHGGPR